MSHQAISWNILAFNIVYRWGRAHGQTALCALMCQDRGMEVNSLLEMGPAGRSILLDRARKGFDYVVTTLEDCFR